MIPPEVRAEIRRLVLIEHMCIETVARKFGVHHSVVRRALRQESPAGPQKAQSALDPFKPYVVKRILELPELSSVRLLDELRQRGYQQSIAIGVRIFSVDENQS